MSKLLSTLLAGAAALAMSGPVMAADQQSRDNQTEAQPNDTTPGKPGQSDANRAQSPNDSATTNPQSQKGGPNDSAQGKPTQNQANQAGTEGQTGGNMSAKQKAYSADLKKCDSMASDQKRRCIATANKKHGPMAEQTPSGAPTADQQTSADASNNSARSAPADSQATQSGNQAEQAGNQAGQSDSNTGNATAGRTEDQTSGDVSAQYSADIKKCDSLTSEQKQKCVATAKKKHGQM
ncbi:MAG: hypothetical protein H7X76_04735 [Prolixibacteraceae bacterium]|nr:hypothetical protein [Burkholderiales bacterium]